MEKAQAERDAIAALSRLELECFQRESDARVAAAAIPAGNSGQAPKRTTAEADDEILGEIPPKFQICPSSSPASPGKKL